MSENKNLDPKLKETLKGIYDGLSDELKEKAKACKTMEELTALAAKESVELPDEVLDAVAGGSCWDDCNYGAPAGCYYGDPNNCSCYGGNC